MTNRHRQNGDSGFYEPYIQYSRTLRAWLVAYGIGLPVLLASQDIIARAIIRAGTGKWITWIFLSGVIVQVIATFLYKYSQEYLYHEEIGADLKDTRRLAVAKWLSNTIWFEMAMDVISIALFVFGTFKVVVAVLSPA